MGPLVPDIISDELNLIVGLLLGIGFGFLLEQAGFSSCRKLTGLFYGTDFTVLRVFFSAAITAMFGVILLEGVGLLDTQLLFVHPTFLWAALAGGGIMGLGFLLGGYCPGTSFCAAAIGKIDGMVFIVGGLLGVFAFAEAFPTIEEFYGAASRGELQVHDALGVSRALFAVILTVVAVMAFIVTGLIEKKVNPDAPSKSFPRLRHALAMLLVLAIAGLAFLTPDRETRLMDQAKSAAWQKAHPIPTMSVDELAFRLLDEDPTLLIVDVRSAGAFASLALPQAVNLPEEDLFRKGAGELLGSRRRQRVFVSEFEEDARRAATLAASLGHRNLVVLEGGLRAFREQILKAAPASAEADQTLAFRARAGETLTRRMKERGAPRAATVVKKKVQGGCGL